MNVLLQIFVLTTVVAVALCVVPVTDTNTGVRLVMKVHKLHQAGLVPDDVVTDTCTVGAPFLLACQATPAEPACTAAGAACGIYGAGRWFWDKLVG